MNHITTNVQKRPADQFPSKLRTQYLARLAGRCVILILCVAAAIKMPDMLQILDGWEFFRSFSALHLLWGIWMADMLFQLIPVRKYVPLGSQKLFRLHFLPAADPMDALALDRYMTAAAKRAYHIFLLWAALILGIGGLLYKHVIDRTIVFLISVFFYVCDLICVLIWCPFRLYLGNRCCTTCRIFNWDHLMMLSPMVWIGGFFALSLFAMALLVWLVWERNVLRHPERFWEQTNDALKCARCTDKLCTQYCRRRDSVR